MVYDAPKHNGVYSTRYNYMGKYLPSGVPSSNLPLPFPLFYLSANHLTGKNLIGRYLEIAPKQICHDITHLDKFFQDVLDRGGEGVILRDPESPYQPGRSGGYLKHKVCNSLPHLPLSCALSDLQFPLSEISRCGGESHRVQGGHVRMRNVCTSLTHKIIYFTNLSFITYQA